jgi:hypothetical protein
MLSRVVRRVAVGGMLVVGGFFILFAVGYAMEDPGGLAGAALSAAMILPAVALSWVAWRRPTVGARIVVPLVALAAAAWVVLPFASETLRDFFNRAGPVFAIATAVVVVATAALGFHRSRLAGWLLVGLAVLNGAGVFLEDVVRGGGGPGPLGLLGTSGGVLVVPTLIAGVLLVLADRLEHHHLVVHAGHAAHA